MNPLPLFPEPSTLPSPDSSPTNTSIGLPVGWEVKRLGEITQKPIIYGIVQAGPHVEGGLPYIKSTDLSGENIILKNLQRTTQAIAQKYKRSEVVPGDIIFSLRGNIGVSKILPPDIDLANLTQGTARISVAKNFVNHFVKYALESPALQKKIGEVGKGSTFKEISIDTLRKLELLIPPLAEQRKIATILGTWDTAIGQAQRLLSALRQRHRGLMQHLLMGKTRLAGFEGAWENVLFREIFERVSRRNAELNTNVLTISGQQGLISQGRYFNKNIASEDVKNYYLLHRGEFA